MGCKCLQCWTLYIDSEAGQKMVCRYVAEIVSLEDDTYEASCMRKQDSKGVTY